MPSGSRLLKKLGVLTAFLAALLLLAACDGQVPLIPSPTPQPTLYAATPVRIICADSLEPAVRAVASDFQRAHPEVDISVMPRADGLALQALRQGEADVALMTWLPDDVPDDAWIRPAARDGLAVVVHPQNGLPGVTMEQLQDLYQGQLDDWASWGGLPGAPQLITRETASGAYQLFQAWVMQDARISLNALMAPSTTAMRQFVAEDHWAVGYISAAWLDDTVRAVALDGIPPTAEAIAAGHYPLTQTIFVVTLAEPDGAARGFVQWLLEPPGQGMLEAYGFLPAP